MIILEGPDGGGKSGLAQRLSRDLEMPIAAKVVGSDTRPMVDSLQTWVEDNLRTGFQATIFDRHRLISEPIYGPVIRGTLSDGFNDREWFSQMWHLFERSQPVIVYCIPPLQTVLDNLRSDPMNTVVLDKIVTIYWQYWGMLCRDSTKAAVVHWDYTTTDRHYHDMVRFIRAWTDRRLA